MSEKQAPHTIEDVHEVAGVLAAYAASVSARHIRNGMLRLKFNREISDFASGITDEVKQEKKSPDQGVHAMRQEYQSLKQEIRELLYRSTLGPSFNAFHKSPFERISLISLKRKKSGTDNKRLARYLQIEKLQAEEAARLKDHFIYPKSKPKPVEDKAQKPVPELVEFYDPGFYIVPKSTTVEKLKAELFNSPTTAVLDKFRALNPELGPQVKAGQMIVLSDPTNTQCTEAEALLMTAVQRVNDILQNMTPEEADFMTRYGKEIESFLSHGSTSMGVAEVALGKHMESIKVLLQDIDTLHSETLAKHGHLKSEEFFARRKQLLSNLDKQLNGLTKKSIGFPDHPKLKSALGISSRSLVHQYRLSGVYQQSPGYLKHLEGVAKAAKYIKGGGYVGIALGGGASAVKVQGVCAKGDEEACEKIKYTESAAFVGGVAGGALGSAYFGAGAAATICAALGVPSFGVGTVVCAAVVTAGGSYALGKAVEKGAEYSADKIYEASK